MLEGSPCRGQIEFFNDGTECCLFVDNTKGGPGSDEHPSVGVLRRTIERLATDPDRQPHVHTTVTMAWMKMADAISAEVRKHGRKRMTLAEIVRLAASCGLGQLVGVPLMARTGPSLRGHRNEYRGRRGHRHR